jgi:hypothetical protein
MNQDQWQIRAVKTVFPHTNVLLCIWHVNKKIYEKILPSLKKQFKTSENGKEIAEFLANAYAPFEADW